MDWMWRKVVELCTTDGVLTLVIMATGIAVAIGLTCASRQLVLSLRPDKPENPEGEE